MFLADMFKDLGMRDRDKRAKQEDRPLEERRHHHTHHHHHHHERPKTASQTSDQLDKHHRRSHQEERNHRPGPELPLFANHIGDGISRQSKDSHHELQRRNAPGPEKQVRAEQNLMMAMAEQPNMDYLMVLKEDGPQYPIDAKELLILQYPHYSPRNSGWRPLPSQTMPQSRALQQLLSRLDAKPSKSQEAAATRIRATEGKPITWELLVKMFNDLDTLVFSGDLYHRVCFRWVDMRFTAEEYSGQLGFAQTPGPGRWNTERIRICMSSDLNWRQWPRFYALGVLLHEMLHAYFMVWCGDNDIGSAEGHHHGPMFTRAAKRIEKYTGMDLTSNPDKWMDQMGMIRSMLRSPFCGNGSLKKLG
ncbi:hypothetical protein LTR08_007873 [Meristemomyces frigidus]|nr:hypothetical protein LTR08_007873 [Meristemomyces frigidus]